MSDLNACTLVSKTPRSTHLLFSHRCEIFSTDRKSRQNLVHSAKDMELQDDMLTEAIRRSLIDVEHGGYSETHLYNAENNDSVYRNGDLFLTEREINDSQINTYTIPTNQADLERETGIKMQPQIGMASPGQMWMDCIKETFEDKWLDLHPEYVEAVSLPDCCGITKSILGDKDATTKSDCASKILGASAANCTDDLRSNHKGGGVRHGTSSILQSNHNRKSKFDKVVMDGQAKVQDAADERKKLNKTRANAIRLNTTPLHSAVVKDHTKCLETLCKKFPHLIDSQNMYGETALFLAAKCCHSDCVKILLESKADDKLKTAQLRGSETALFAAVHGSDDRNQENHNTSQSESYEKIVEDLVAYGSRGDWPANRGYTAIHEAASHGLIKILRTLLTKSTNYSPSGCKSTNQMNLELEDYGGVTPLYMAVCADDADVIKMLISFGANVDKMTKTKPETALHVAANKGLFSAVEALVQGNANTCVLNERGMFPIHLACEQDHYEVVEYLIKHTSQWEIEKCDRSPLHCCADRDRYYTAELLLENG